MSEYEEQRPKSPRPLLEIRNVTKSFPGVQALSEVSLSVASAAVHGVVGENGAGKSTLMRILAGVYRPDSGGILWDGEPLILRKPGDARDRGISIIHQEFALLPDLTVAENIFFNREPRARFGVLDWTRMRAQSRRLLDALEADVDVGLEVRALSVAQQQLVEIAKALSADARLIIMDEPTAALKSTEVELLFKVIHRLTKEGRAVIFISHRIDEVLRICDTVTILKDGRLVATKPTSVLSKEDIVQMMVGRTLAALFPERRKRGSQTPVFAINRLTTPNVQDVTFSLEPGEVLGIAGLEGHGQVHLARALCGLEQVESGEMTLAGKPVHFRHPGEAIKAGVAFVSDDRKGEGLALMLSIRENFALPNVRHFSKYWVMATARERKAAEAAMAEIGVRTPSVEREVRDLSGGNQQKVVLAKLMVGRPLIFVFVEPTRGIDVGAKMEIYRMMRAFVELGHGIVMVSSDMLELLGLADRLLVMRQGRVAAEFAGATATEQDIMRAATGTVVGV